MLSPHKTTATKTNLAGKPQKEKQYEQLEHSRMLFAFVAMTIKSVNSSGYFKIIPNGINKESQAKTLVPLFNT